MENKGNFRRKKFSLFRKFSPTYHFEASPKGIISDPQGSYTGTPLNSTGEPDYNEYPTQDADDL